MEKTKKEEGLYHKYKIERKDGEPLDPWGNYFVLRIDKDIAAQKAIHLYSQEITNKQLSKDLQDQLKKYEYNFNENHIYSIVFQDLDFVLNFLEKENPSTNYKYKGIVTVTKEIEAKAINVPFSKGYRKIIDMPDESNKILTEDDISGNLYIKARNTDFYYQFFYSPY